jgi:hypothetical protein
MPNKKTNRNGLHRAKVFDDMTAATRQLAVDLDRDFARVHQDGLLLRHDAGRTLARVIAEEATYGSSAVEQLATYLVMSPDRLYKLRTYALVFTREQIVQWAERRTSDGGRIRYHHLAAIMVVRSPQERLQLIERVFAESLSVRALRAVIAGEGCGTGDGKSSARQPKSLLRDLSRLIEHSQTMVKKFEKWEKDVFLRMEQPNAARFEPILRNKTIVAQKVLEELAGSICVALKRLSGGLHGAGAESAKGQAA